MGLLGGTALLAAATVSSGVYVAVFAIYALYCTSLSYGADATGIVAFFSLPIGPTAFFGLDQNSGMVGMYITMTQALVALEVAMGVGERDVITANRVVATVTGVLMAMVVAVVPPQRRGSDVEPIKALLQQIEEAFVSGCRIMLEEGRPGGKDAKNALDDLRGGLYVQSYTSEVQDRLPFEGCVTIGSCAFLPSG